MAELRRSGSLDISDEWERAWCERYAPRSKAPRSRRRAPRARTATLWAGLLTLTASSFAVAQTTDPDPHAGAARGEGDPLALGQRNPASGAATRETAMVANAGSGGLVLRPSNTAKGGRAISATCDNDGVSDEDGCAVYVNKGTGAAASFRTRGSVPFALRSTNTGLVRYLNSDMLDGRNATDFLGRTEKAADAEALNGRDSSEFLGVAGKAADAEQLDGMNSTDFLGRTAKAADSDQLDGMNSTDFLGQNAKAADSELLDGMNSSDFLGASAKAADSDRLDGRDATQFARFGGWVNSAGVPIQGSGFNSTRNGPGEYTIIFPGGTFPNDGAPCTFPIVVALPATVAPLFATSPTASCAGTGSGTATVRLYNLAGTPTDASFTFIVL